MRLFPLCPRSGRKFPCCCDPGLLLILTGCAVVVTAGAFAVDRARQASRAIPSLADARSGRPPPFMLSDVREAFLEPGTAAPPLVLTDFRTGRRVRLDSFQGDRPVVLLFGSFGSRLLSDQLGRLRGLYDDFKGRVAFLLVEITQPPHSGPEQRSLAGDLGPEAGSPEARRQRIAEGLEEEDLPFPCLIDEDGRAEAAYAAYPQ